MIAFDARITSHMSAGMRTYTQELLARMPRLAPDLGIVPFGGGDNFDLAEQAGMPAWIARNRPALVHYPTPFAPLITPCAYVVTIHDLIELRFPRYSKATAAPYYRYIVGRLARGAARVICDDPRVAAELETLLGVDGTRVRVVPLGVDEAFLAGVPRSEPARPYVLYVGNARPHKNLETLFAAWSRLPDGLELDLHLTGSEPSSGSVRERPGGTVRRLGELDREALLEAYAGARALVHPSFAEGFGLTMLEASALGTPVIAARESLPAVLDGLALTFPARDPDALALLLRRAAEDPAGMRELGDRAQAVARGYTWDRCAAATIAVYRELIDR